LKRPADIFFERLTIVMDNNESSEIGVSQSKRARRRIEPISDASIATFLDARADCEERRQLLERALLRSRINGVVKQDIAVQVVLLTKSRFVVKDILNA
jgi:hypothetical protein